MLGFIKNSFIPNNQTFHEKLDFTFNETPFLENFLQPCSSETNASNIKCTTTLCVTKCSSNMNSSLLRYLFLQKLITNFIHSSVYHTEGVLFSLFTAFDVFIVNLFLTYIVKK